jgi:hypothetical protein
VYSSIIVPQPPDEQYDTHSIPVLPLITAAAALIVASKVDDKDDDVFYCRLRTDYVFLKKMRP